MITHKLLLGLLKVFSLFAQLIHLIYLIKDFSQQKQYIAKPSVVLLQQYM